jgi:hypothetical protein
MFQDYAAQTVSSQSFQPAPQAGIRVQVEFGLIGTEEVEHTRTRFNFQDSAGQVGQGESYRSARGYAVTPVGRLQWPKSGQGVCQRYGSDLVT